MKVVSFGDELELVGSTIVIRKRGMANAMASGMNGERSIPVRDISAIGFKVGGTFSPGFIQFSYPGGKPFRGGLIEATQDPDAFIFNKAFNEEVLAFKRAVEGLMANRGSESPDDLPMQIERLGALHRDGVLTSEEFARAKERLLSGGN